MYIHICVCIFIYIYIYVCIIYYKYIDHLKRGYSLIIQQLAWFQKHSAEVIQPWSRMELPKYHGKCLFHPTLVSVPKPETKKTHNTFATRPRCRQTKCFFFWDIYIPLRWLQFGTSSFEIYIYILLGPSASPEKKHSEISSPPKWGSS